MNAILQSRTVPGKGNRHNGLPVTTSIDVEFTSHFSFEPRIKNHMNSISLEEMLAGASASRIAPPTDASGPASTLKTPRWPERGSFTEWNSPPEMLDDATATDQRDSDIFEASLRAITLQRRRDNSMPELKLVEFFVELSEAKSVQLTADFTDWEEYPLDMIRFDGGIWSTTVPLPAGIYAYRFLVDGEWYDDPRGVRRDANCCGAAKAFVHVK
jgi:hypothetical protein